MAFLPDRPPHLGGLPTLPTPKRYHRFPKAARLPSRPWPAFLWMRTPYALVADRGWQRKFDDPIQLPRGRQLVTLEDAGDYITRLPKAEHEAQEWQAARAERPSRDRRSIRGLRENAARYRPCRPPAAGCANASPPKWRLGCQRDDCDLLTPMSFNWVA